MADVLERLDLAQAMADRGISVFIVTPGSKRPLEGFSWYLRQTQDPDQVAAWFDETPDCNYGLHLGGQHVVIDLDRKPEANGVAAFEALCRENGIEVFTLELDTLMVRTPGGGYHLYFRAPFPCSNKNTLPEGIDVRGVQGYVVGPGSADSRGQWEVIDAEADIIDLPDWLEAYVVEPGYKDPNRNIPVVELDLPENVEHAKDWLKNRKPAVQGKNGDDWTYQTILYLRDFGISEGNVATVLAEWNARCEPPWGPEELEAKVRNSYEYGQNRPGVKSPTHKVQQVIKGHCAGGTLTDAQVRELFHPGRGGTGLALVVDNDADDSDIPEEEAQANRWAALTYKGDSIKAIKPPVPIIPGFLLSAGVTACLAPRRTGKTVIVLDMGLNLANGTPWAGERVAQGWHVVYLCGEDHENSAAHVHAWAETHNGGAVPERFTFMGDVPDLLAGEGDVKPLAEHVAELVPEGARVCWIVDTWQRATTGAGQNEDKDMKPAFKNLEALAARFRGPAVACFHPPKDNARTISGVMFQENAAVAMWGIEKTDDSPDSPRRFEVLNIKGKGEGFHKLFAFNPVELGEPDPYFGERPLGLIAEHIGGTGESTVQKAERKRQEDAQAKELADKVLAVVTEYLEAGRRVVASNKGAGAVKLKELAAKLRRKDKAVEAALSRLVDEGRLEYQEAHGKVRATFRLPSTPVEKG